MVDAGSRAGRGVDASRYAPAFTLIELLVCLSVIALLLTLVAPRYFPSVSRAEETVLKSNLALLRDALDKYHADSGHYPNSLEELVRKRYIRNIPLDPVTRSEKTWQLVPAETPAADGVFDVRSGAVGTARDGTKYSDW